MGSNFGTPPLTTVDDEAFNRRLSRAITNDGPEQACLLIREARREIVLSNGIKYLLSLRCPYPQAHSVDVEDKLWDSVTGTFTRIFLGLRKFDIRNPFPWLNRVHYLLCKNHWADCIRPEQTAEIPEEGRSVTMSALRNPEEIAIAEERELTISIVAGVLWKSLSDNDRVFLRMRVFEGLKHPEIATRRQMTEDAVKMTFCRLRLKAASILIGHGYEPETIKNILRRK
jgi:DNA-directed RNA polymerase specialized sigma24 family protein